MSFADLFSTNNSDSLPEWLQSGIGIVDSGLDIYERIAGGGEGPVLEPMERTTSAPANPFGSTTTVLLIGAAVLAFIVLSKKK